MRSVLYRPIAMTFEMASKVGVFFFVDFLFVAMAAVGAIWSK
jgi:hypothetical protein